MSRAKSTEWILKLVDQVTGPMNRIADSVAGTTRKVAQLNEHIERVNERSGKLARNFRNVALGGAAVGLAAQQTLAFSDNIQKQQLTVQQLFGDSSKSAESQRLQMQALTSQAKALSAVYEQDFNQVMEAANGLSKQFGIEQSAAFDLINKGFLSGANATGDFLQQVREYPTLMKEAGISAEQMIGIISQQVKDGVYSDKGIDAIKEAMLSIREMTPNAAKAINGLGLDAAKMQADIASGSISVFDAIQQISVAFAKADPTKKGAALADIFKGAGEDAGEQFISNLGTMNADLDKMIDKNNPLIAKLQERLSIEQQIANEQQNVVNNLAPATLLLQESFMKAKLAALQMVSAVASILVEFGQANPTLSKFIAIAGLATTGIYMLVTATTILGLKFVALRAKIMLATVSSNVFVASMARVSIWIGTAVVGLAAWALRATIFVARNALMIASNISLAAVTGVVTAAQWLLNAALMANPFGLVIGLIAGLVAVVALVIGKYEQWSGVLTMLLGPLGLVINLVVSFKNHWASIKNAFSAGGMIAGLKRIGFVLIDALLMPVQSLLNLLAKIPGLSNLAASGAAKIAAIRERLDKGTQVIKVEEEISRKESDAKSSIDQRSKAEQSNIDRANGNANLSNAKTTQGSNEVAGQASASGSRVLNQTLNINIEYKLEDGELRNNARQFSDDIIAHLAANLREGALQTING